MESLPELENLTAAQDRPRPKWKRPVFWCSFVVLLLANAYYVAVTWLPRWAPAFTSEYIRHPIALARAIATQLEQGNSNAADETRNQMRAVWFAPQDASGEFLFTPWAQERFRKLYLSGNQWEKQAVLQICSEFTCPDCADVISADIPTFDRDGKLLAARALARKHTPAGVAGLHVLLSDSVTEVRLKTVGAIQDGAFRLTEQEQRTSSLNLLRGASQLDGDVQVHECAAYQLAMLRSYYWKDSFKVSPDDELLQLLRCPFESVRARLSGDLVAKEFHGRLDPHWYPLLYSIFSQDSLEDTRGNIALVLILADWPQSDQLLRFIETLCVGGYGIKPITKAKIRKELEALLPNGLTIQFLLKEWSPNRSNNTFRRVPIGA